jgi:chromosome transmission fidelity protein 4
MNIGHLRDSADDNTMTIKQTQVALDKELLQLVQGACKADNLQRALDLTRLMHNPASVDAAAKIAGFYHLPGLQERMGGVKDGVERKRRKVERKRLDPVIYSGGGGGGGNVNGGGTSKGFNDFAPRATARRSFGGKVRDRDSTPANPTSNGNGTYIPETPGTEVEMEFETSAPASAVVPETSGYRSPSPDMKRKRDDESFAPTSKKVDSSFKGMSLSFIRKEGRRQEGADDQNLPKTHLPKNHKVQIHLLNPPRPPNRWMQLNQLHSSNGSIRLNRQV